jgi:hypothetical protein
VTALSIVACCGSGSGLACIGGSGFISSGSISGFGSVFVNGVEFETNESTFDIEGVPGTQGDLAIGMIVRVSGTINDDGITGTATGISFDDELQGPVSNITSPNLNGITRSFSVFEINVIIDSGTTTFDLSDDLSTITAFSFSDIANNNNVEISGFFDADGSLVATRVELKDRVFDTSNSVVEIKGTVSNFNAGTNTFNLGAFSINAASADIDNLPNGLADGQFVEVKGTFDLATTITASKVEGENNSFEDTDEFELEGLVTNFVNNSNFKIAGTSVDASNANFKPSTLKLTLQDGARVEAEGTIVNGILIASEVELRGGDAKLKATVSNLSVVNNTFDVIPVDVGGQPAIKVTVTNTTKIEDGVNGMKPFGLSNIAIDDYVEINGIENSNGGITATEVKVETADSILVQGIIQTGSNETNGIIKIFGVEFIIDVNNTTFEDSNDNSLSLTEFFDSTKGGVTIDTTIVKVETDVANGIINKVEIE